LTHTRQTHSGRSDVDVDASDTWTFMVWMSSRSVILSEEEEDGEAGERLLLLRRI